MQKALYAKTCCIPNHYPPGLSRTTLTVTCPPYYPVATLFLVGGEAGFIGSYIVDRQLEDGCRIRVFIGGFR